MAPYQNDRLPQPPAIGYVNLRTLPQMIGMEHEDRINRLTRLSALHSVKPPQIDQLQLNTGLLSGLNYPVPVVRIIFDDGVLFDFNSDIVRLEGEKILDIIADNMKHDVPDARLLILGHTDAIGSDDYNFSLSRRRALSVMRGLLARGVRSSQMATVAIGKSQPRAPNDTEAGRALNRRVEFMISAEQQANIMLVQRRRINEAFLKVAISDPPAPAKPQQVEVDQFTAKPDSTPQVDQAAAVMDPRPELQSPAVLGPQPDLEPVQRIELQIPSEPSFTVNRPVDVEVNRLNNEFQL